MLTLVIINLVWLDKTLTSIFTKKPQVLKLEFDMCTFCVSHLGRPFWVENVPKCFSAFYVWWRKFSIN